MSCAIWFWIIFVISLLFFGYTSFTPANTPANPSARWSWFVLFVLLGLLGWRVFGHPVQ